MEMILKLQNHELLMVVLINKIRSLGLPRDSVANRTHHEKKVALGVDEDWKGLGVDELTLLLLQFEDLGVFACEEFWKVDHCLYWNFWK